MAEELDRHNELQIIARSKHPCGLPLSLLLISPASLNLTETLATMPNAEVSSPWVHGDDTHGKSVT